MLFLSKCNKNSDNWVGSGLVLAERFFVILTHDTEAALIAFGFPGQANIPSVEDQPVMRFVN